MAKKTTLTVIVSLILIALIVLITNLGISVFYEGPEYRDYCDVNFAKPMNETTIPDVDYEQCNADYEEVRKDYEQTIFYIFAGIGFVLLLLGLFIDFPAVQWTGLGAGGILVAESIVRNFENKTTVFIASVAILIIFVIFAIRKLKGGDN